jgi:hypothetical protein
MMRAFLARQGDVAVWGIAVAGLAALTLLGFVVFGTLQGLIWILDRLQGRNA